MMLSGLEIENLLDTDIEIKPFNRNQLNPNSYNVKLHNELIEYDCDVIDMKKDNPHHIITIPDDGLILFPNKLYLGRTVEFISTSNNNNENKVYMPMISGRSSIGRLGINIHATAGFGDAGFSGYFTLEISVVQPVRIYPYCEIGQVYFEEVTTPCEKYHGKYQNNTGIQTSQIFRDFD